MENIENANMVRLTENQWIEYFGFQRFPFDRPEAGNEEFARPDFLAACFVEPHSFERVLGQADAPVSSLLFAARGSGKTACRVMVDYYCHRGEVNRERRQDHASYVLSVPHIHLHQVLNMARQDAPSEETPAVRVEHHAVEIMRRAVPAIVDLIARAPELSNNIRGLPYAEKQDLSWLILNYSHYLNSLQARFLHSIGIGAPVEERPSMGFQAHRAPSTEQPIWENLLMQKRLQVSPLDHIGQWARLVRQSGISATYVLVDGVDEFEESASDPDTAFLLIRPLLTNLRLMDGTPYLALKFFLPDHIEHLVMMDQGVRRDRGFIVESIVWQQEDMIKILRKRLAALKRREDIDRDRLETGFDALCVPELRGRIEIELAELAGGNPRYLMLLCGMMVSAHCARDVSNQDDPYQLNMTDLQMAITRFENMISGFRQILDQSTIPAVRELITRGESDGLEFKSSLRWDYDKGAVNKELQAVIARTIAGMLNSNGGILLIGVADDGTVLGIEKDLTGLRKQDIDGFQLLLTNTVITYLGIEYTAYLRIRFEQIDKRTVCVLLIQKSGTPVYFSGENAPEFWVRAGSSTRQLDVKAAMYYIQNHWRDT